MYFLNNLILSNEYLKNTSFWWWYSMINHYGFRFDDYYKYRYFWNKINSGWIDMTYNYEYKKTWKKMTKNKFKSQNVLCKPGIGSKLWKIQRL